MIPAHPDPLGPPAAAGDPVESIARAVLYEGYVLWPYRRSAVKNQRRWTFGGVYPRGFCETAAEGDASEVRCEALLEVDAEGDATTRVAVELRFLHVVHRQALAVERRDLRPVDRLEAGAESHLTWDEASERRHVLPEAEIGALLAWPIEETLEVPAGGDLEQVWNAAGGLAGVLERTWQGVEATVRVAAEPLGGRLHRISATVANASAWRGGDRTEAQRRSLVSTHLVLRVRGGAFHSLADPPGHLAEAAAGCRNLGVWPVLVGEPGARDTLLASPIILEDHPRIAPESPGDLFDGGEIDQLLVLNILTLTDEEKREMAATDSRAREILERTEGLGPEELMRLHGAFRDPRGPLARRGP